MRTAVFHTVNSGIYLWDGKSGILVDGLHHGTQQGFSETPLEICRQLSRHDGLFSRLNGLLFTHLHPDHFDRHKLLLALDSRYPPLVYGPNLFETTIPARRILPDAWLFRIRDIQVLSVETPHDGQQYRGTPHQSMLFYDGRESIFVAGDAILEEERVDLLRNFFDVPISAAFINIYQAFSAQGLAFLRRLQPQRIFLYHLPIEKDDKFNYLPLAQSAQKRFPSDLPKIEILEPMKWIDRVPKDWRADGNRLHKPSIVPQRRTLL